MGILQDLDAAIRSYIADSVSLDVVDVTTQGSSINIQEVCGFQARVSNNGLLKMTDVSLQIDGLNGTLVGTVEYRTVVAVAHRQQPQRAGRRRARYGEPSLQGARLAAAGVHHARERARQELEGRPGRLARRQQHRRAEPNRALSEPGLPVVLSGGFAPGYPYTLSRGGPFAPLRSRGSLRSLAFAAIERCSTTRRVPAQTLRVST